MLIILALNGNKPVSRAAYLLKKSEIVPNIEMHGQQLVRRALNKSVMRGSLVFSYDSRWSSLYHGKENMYFLFDVEKEKLVALRNKIRARDNIDSQFNEIYNGASNMMESEGFSISLMNF